MLEVDIDESKLLEKQRAGLKFDLKNAKVYESKNGFHFTDFLDPIDAILPNIDSSRFTEDVRQYIERKLQSNEGRFRKQSSVVGHYVTLRGARCLDVGCGGGLFLSLLKARGAKVWAIEPNDSRAHYAKTTYALEVHKLPVENEYWQRGYKDTFDLITLWDVIEHVNFPIQTLQAATRLLKKGGYLILDTPCKDSLYYRLGAFTYRVSKGRWPSFLNAIYRNEPFGHKQIFSTSEMKAALEVCDLACVSLTRFHELSFPVDHYLTRMHFSKHIAKVLGAVFGWIVTFIRIKNKMLVVAQKVQT